MENSLIGLYSYYKNQRRENRTVKESIIELYKKYIKDKEATIIDAITASAAVNAIFLSDQIDYSKITPQMEEAFKLAYPNLELSSLSEYSTEQLNGIISGWKGKYFEVLVRDKLNSGEWIGDLHLEEGQYAELASNPTQPGWDLQIFDSNDEVIEELQIKATQSLSYIKSALEKYPDIDIITTDDVLNSADGLADDLIFSDVSDGELETQIMEPLQSLFDSPVEEFLENILPGLPFIIIAATEGRKVLMGKKTFQLALANSFERAIKTGAAIGVGALVSFLDGGLLSIPASFLTRIGFDRYKIIGNAINRLEIEKNNLNKLLVRYQYYS